MILQTDSYKVTHWAMYPKGMTKMKSYFSSRGGEYDSVCFFGLQVRFCHVMFNLF
jgi:nicotinamide phosphoribosyltransferase